MNLNLNTMKYALTSRILHWVMALLIIFLLGLGIYMSDFLSKESPNHLEVYNLHKSLGVVVLILVFLRIINRLLTRTPALPFAISALEKKLAKFGHFALYFLMFTTPFSGYLMSSFAGYPVKLFAIELPNFFEANYKIAEFFSEVHELSAFTLLGLIVIHILAVIRHRFFDKPGNDVLNRMM
jgi:cytochrome b561